MLKNKGFIMKAIKLSALVFSILSTSAYSAVNLESIIPKKSLSSDLLELGFNPHSLTHQGGQALSAAGFDVYGAVGSRENQAHILKRTLYSDFT